MYVNANCCFDVKDYFFLYLIRNISLTKIVLDKQINPINLFVIFQTPRKDLSLLLLATFI
ncbi:MAG: hypothetical protein DUD34_00300 [Lactobacillus sp.]|nr:MAG: hypothetical protein DUD34_00300 [Lactobacillus sp.]